jgi:hypothetical protein
MLYDGLVPGNSDLLPSAGIGSLQTEDTVLLAFSQQRFAKTL